MQGSHYYLPTYRRLVIAPWIKWLPSIEMGMDVVLCTIKTDQSSLETRHEMEKQKKKGGHERILYSL